MGQLHPPTARPFVGRVHEIACLRAGLTDASAGRGGLFLVTGEPGIGKTRLAEELAEEARRAGATVLWGRCWEGGGAPAYWPWIQILRACPTAESPSASAQPVASTAADLAQLLPARVAAQASTTGTVPIDPEQARFHLFDEVATCLRAAAVQHPLVLILDDLHAADSDSLLLLQFLARELQSAAALLIGTCRDATVYQPEQAVRPLAALSRDSAVVPLRGLSAEEVGEFVRRCASGLSAPDAPVSAAAAARIYQRTEGNPFFVDAVVRLAIAEGWLEEPDRPEPWYVPDQVREAVRRQMQRLPATTVDVLAMAAVIGREFDLAILERVAADTGPVPLIDHLDAARRAGVLVELRVGPRRYGFSHGLFRETLYDDLSSTRRLELHHAIGAAMEECYRTTLEAHLTDIAHHFIVAADGGDAERAVHYATRAAAQATAVRAYDDAVVHAQRALATFDRAVLADASEQLRRRCDLLLLLGGAQNAAGDRSSAKQTFRAAGDGARQLDAPDALARAALGYGGEWSGTQEVAKFELPAGMVHDDYLARWLTEASDALGDENPGLRAQLLSRLSVEVIHTATLAHRDALSEEAVAIARTLNAPATLARVLCDRHVAIWEPDSLFERVAMAQEILGLAMVLHDPALELIGLAWRIGDLFEAGDWRATDVDLERFRHLAEAYRQPGYLWGLHGHLAMRALVTGDFDEAERRAREAFRIGRQTHAAALVVYGVQMRALWQERGQTEQLLAVEPVLKAAADQYPTLPSVRMELALLYVRLGRDTEARAEFEQLAAQQFTNVPRDNNWLYCVAGLSEICTHLGDATRAKMLYEMMQPYAEQFPLSAFAALSWGSAARSLGMLASALQEWEAAEAYFETALQHNRARAARPWVARTLYAYATMLCQRGQPGDPSRAAAMLTEGLATAQALGMAPLAAQTSALLDHVGTAAGSLPVGASEHVPETPPPALEERPHVLRHQGDFWTMIYEGRTCQLRDARGLHYLAQLLRHPGREFHASELVATPGDGARSAAEEPHSPVRLGLGDAGPILDHEAMVAYRERLSELREESAEAERCNDIGRASHVRDEIEALTAELAAAARGRRASSHAERARLTVTKGIKTVLEKIGRIHPPLAQHFAATVKRGYFCSYTPDPRYPITWAE